MAATHPAAIEARALAWEILQAVDAGAFADTVIGRERRLGGLDRRDRALAIRIVYGTLAWQGYLDAILRGCSARPLESLDTPILVLLRLALFQITKLTRVPPFAVVDTAVELSKRHRRGSARSLVNAVLRRALREWQEIPIPTLEADAAANLSIRLSHPLWLVRHWIDELGIDEAAALATANNDEAPTTLRVNAMRAARDTVIAELRDAGCTAEAANWSATAIHIEAAGSPHELRAFKEGRASLQGEASQLVGLLTGVRPGDRVLDACAAPGGKATHLAEIMGDKGTIIALDPTAGGVRRVSAMATRLGLRCIAAEIGDSTVWRPAAAQPQEFDCVLVDAPCTGLGTLRGHPEIRWRRTPADVARAAELQRRLLSRMAPLVRPGGTLVYATCTIAQEDNEKTVAWILAREPELAVDDPRPLLPAAARSLIGSDRYLRTSPNRHGLDGFFAARLKRREPQGIVSA